MQDARMTTEQLAELAEALSILSAKSSVLKERDELRALMEENMSAEEVQYLFQIPDSIANSVIGNSARQTHSQHDHEARCTTIGV